MSKKTGTKVPVALARAKAVKARGLPATRKSTRGVGIKYSKKAAKPARPAADGGQDPRHQFVALVMRIGTEQAQRLLDRVVDVQTPLSPSVKR